MTVLKTAAVVVARMLAVSVVVVVVVVVVVEVEMIETESTQESRWNFC